MEANVGKYSPHTMDYFCHLPLCHYGVGATTRENLLGHPKIVFENIENTLNKTVTPEAIWMMEWGMAVLYGIAGARASGKCEPGYPYPATCSFQKKHKKVAAAATKGKAKGKATTLHKVLPSPAPKADGEADGMEESI